MTIHEQGRVNVCGRCIINFDISLCASSGRRHTYAPPSTHTHTHMHGHRHLLHSYAEDRDDCGMDGHDVTH